MKKSFPLFSLLLIIALLSSTVAASASSFNNGINSQAYPSDNVVQVDDCYSLDIIFLIDQSGSMSGDDGNPNDPLGNRFQAPRYAMDWLANNRLGHCPTAVHRIGVISFGSEAEVNLGLTEVNPASQAEWDERRPILENEISEERMGTTNPLLAFQEAQKMIENAPEQGVLLRKTVIILLTDGQPCVEALGCTYGEDHMDHNSYMTSLIEYVNTTFPYSEALMQRESAIKEATEIYGSIDAIPDEERNRILIEYPITREDLSSSVYLWVVAMNSASDYLRDDGAFWNQITINHAGELIDLHENRIEVPKEFNGILSTLEGITPALLGCGNLAIDPYLSGASLDVFKLADTLEVEISYDEKLLKAGLGDIEFFGQEQYSEFGAIEHYRFAQPPAGLWKITAADCQGIEASFIPFKPQIAYVSPTTALPQYNLNGANFDPEDPQKIVVNITDSNNQGNLDLDPNFPLDFTATITMPDGTPVERSISFTADGIWATDDPIPVDQLGTYTIHLFGKAACTYDPDRPNRCVGNEIVVVDDTSGSYSVSPTQLVTFAIIDPTPGEVLPLHSSLLPDKLAKLPIDLAIQLQAEDGSPLDWQAVLNSDERSAFTAVLSAEGQTETITLVPDPQDNSIFRGSFSELKVLEDQQITVTMIGTIKRDQFQLLENTQTVVFEREDTLFRNPNFYYALLGLFILAIIVLIIKMIYDRTNIVLGKLQFINEIGTRDFSINRHRRVTVIKSGLPHELAIKKIIIRNDGSLGGKRKIALHVYPLAAKDFSLSLIDSSAPQSIAGTWRVMYVWGRITPPKPQRYQTKYHKY